MRYCVRLPTIDRRQSRSHIWLVGPHLLNWNVADARADTDMHAIAFVGRLALELSSISDSMTGIGCSQAIANGMFLYSIDDLKSRLKLCLVQGSVTGSRASILT